MQVDMASTFRAITNQQWDDGLRPSTHVFMHQLIDSTRPLAFSLSEAMLAANENELRNAFWSHRNIGDLTPPGFDFLPISYGGSLYAKNSST